MNDLHTQCSLHSDLVVMKCVLEGRMHNIIGCSDNQQVDGDRWCERRKNKGKSVRWDDWLRMRGCENCEHYIGSWGD